jgi:hypothetical protein
MPQRCIAVDGVGGDLAAGSMICRQIIWWNKHTADVRLRDIVTRTNVA